MFFCFLIGVGDPFLEGFKGQPKKTMRGSIPILRSTRMCGFFGGGVGVRTCERLPLPTESLVVTNHNDFPSVQLVQLAGCVYFEGSRYFTGCFGLDVSSTAREAE